jgi:hypothetical protein
MAKLVFPSFIKEGRGRMEDVVLGSWKGIQYMKPYRKSKSSSDNQKQIRAAFGSLSLDWKSLGGTIHKAWEKRVQGRSMTGYNVFMAENMPRRRAGELILLSVGLGELPALSGFMAATGNASGEIVCGFNTPAENHILTFFARNEEEGPNSGMVKRIEAGKAGASAFTITGLDPGARYSVYAVITDLAFPEATSVSESCGVFAVAGK